MAGRGGGGGGEPRGRLRVSAGHLAGEGSTFRCCCWISGTHLDELDMRDDLYTDFCLTPFHQRELEARLGHLVWRKGTAVRPELIEYGPLILNVETYQATIAGRPLDLTYMEYELLKFLASSPGKVFTRETLLSRVWGLRLLRRRPHRGRSRAPLAGQTRRRARRSHHHCEISRLPLRPLPLGAVMVGKVTSCETKCGCPSGSGRLGRNGFDIGACDSSTGR